MLNNGCAQLFTYRGMLRTEIQPVSGSVDLDEFVLSQRASLIYTSESYIRLISNETRSEPYWIVSADSSGIRAVMPVVVKNGRFGPVVNSLAYYGSNGGIVSRGNDPEAKLATLSAYVEFCESVGACASTVITNPLLDDIDFYQKNLPHDLLDERIGQFTYFPEDQDGMTLLSQFEDPRPRNIRKAQRLGVQCTVSQSQDALGFLHATHEQNILSIGGLPKKLAFFQGVFQTFPREAWKVYIAEHNGERVAALLLLYFNRTVEYFTPCVVQKYRSLQALPLLIFQAMSEAMSEGYLRWNWGGTWLTQDGVYAFKKKWSTTDLPYKYFTRLYSQSVKAATREELLEEYSGFFVLPFSVLG